MHPRLPQLSPIAATLCVLLTVPSLTGAMSPKRRAAPAEPLKLRTPPPAPHTVTEPVLLELFTAQGSGPSAKAERALHNLLLDPTIAGRVVPIALHVDYWDGLGWKDPFGSARWSQRQRTYAKLRRTSRIETPAIVLNGYRSIPADRVDVIRAAVKRLSHERRAGRIEIAAQQAPMAARITVKGFLRQAVPGAMVDIVVAAYEDGRFTEIEAGENAGKRMRNDRVVTWMKVIDRIPTLSGSVTHKVVFVPLPANWKGRRFGVVAFMQSQPSMVVHAATTLHVGFGGDVPTRGVRDRPKRKSLLEQPL